jgi:hypothetical protein
MIIMQLEKKVMNGININTETPLSEIICDGDSWVFGCEIADPNLAATYPIGTHPGAYDFLKENDNYRIPKIFSSHLAQILNTTVTNLSWPADDNGTILRRVMNYISQKYLANNLSTEGLFVIVGWTSPERNSFWYKDDTGMSMLFRLWPQVRHFDSKQQEEIWKMYVTHLWNEEEYIPRYVLNVLQFQNFCRTNNIKWMCFNSFYQTPGKSPEKWQDLNLKEEINKLEYRLGGHEFHQSSDPFNRIVHINDYMSLWDSVDSVRFYKKNVPTNTFKSFIEDSSNDVSVPLIGWHPSPEAHKAWAHEIVRYIKENNLL